MLMGTIMAARVGGGMSCCHAAGKGGHCIDAQATGGARPEAEGRMVLCIPAIDLPMVLARVAWGLCIGPGLAHMALVWCHQLHPHACDINTNSHTVCMGLMGAGEPAFHSLGADQVNDSRVCPRCFPWCVMTTHGDCWDRAAVALHSWLGGVAAG